MAQLKDLIVNGAARIIGTTTSSSFVGPLTGNVTGNCSGSSGSCTGNAATATTASACSGNAATATKLASTRTISLTGSVTGSGNFDGSGNLSISTSTNHTHSYLPLSGGTVTGATSFTANVTSTSTTTGTVKITGGLGVTGDIYGAAVHNAIWNDLVDAINIPDEDSVEYGYCYCMDKEGHYHKSSRYMERSYVGIHSDTYGMLMGRDEEHNKLNAAVAGFVLAYVDREYETGTPLTCTEDGYLTEIDSEDMMRNPDMILAKYWKNEPSEEWGDGERLVKVNGRKWVKVR